MTGQRLSQALSSLASVGARRTTIDVVGSRNLQLDVLRGLAILLVFGRHLALPVPDGPIGSLATLWFRIGWLGVDLFFVLSGFLIGGLLIAEIKARESINVTRFLVRRGFKIYPAYFAFIAYLMLWPAMKALLRGGDAWRVISESWHLYWPNLLFLQNYIGTNPAGHTWSLAVEEHFYLLLPFGLLALAATRCFRLLGPICFVAVPLAVLLLRALSVATDDAYSQRMAATHLRIDAMLFGVGVRALAEYSSAVFARLRPWRGPLFAVWLVLWAPNLFVEPDTAFVRTVGLTCGFVGSGALLIAATHTHAADFGRMVGLVRPLAGLAAWIGVYSYGAYLWHTTAMGIVEREAGKRLIDLAGGISTPVWMLSAAIVVVGALLAGVVMTKLVEWPALRARERYFPSVVKRKPPVA